MTAPLISVILPVWKGARFLDEAIRSILGQTEGDFEFIILDDASPDDSLEIIQSHRDPRIVLVRQEVNLGAVRTINHGYDLARGEFIARMDQDDIAHPTRFEKQVARFRQEPELGVLGTAYRVFGKGRVRVVIPPAGHDEIQARMFFECALGDPTVMIRKKVLDAGPFRLDPTFVNCEDYEFWVRLLRQTRFAGLPEVLLDYRRHGQSMTSLHNNDQVLKTHQVRLSQLAGWIPGLTEDEKKNHLFLAAGLSWNADGDLGRIESWALQLSKCNRTGGFLPPEVFDKEIARRYFAVCRSAAHRGLSSWRAFRRSPWKTRNPAGFPDSMEFFFRCLIRFGSGWQRRVRDLLFS